MEIVIGKITETGFPMQRGHPHNREGDVPVRVLKVRSARSRRQNRTFGKNRREDLEASDPARGKVLVLMVPDGARLPPDLETGKYQVRLRILSDKKEDLPDRSEKKATEGNLNVTA